MPSPFGHALAALAVHVAGARDEAERFDVHRFAVVFGSGVAADLDLLFRFTGVHHQGQSHSLGFAVMAGLAAYGMARKGKWAKPGALALTAFMAWMVHLLLDFISRDTHPPIGLMALWPLRHDHFKFPWPLFMDIGRSFDWVTVRHDAIAMTWEAFVLLPILWLAWRYRRGAGGSAAR